MSSLSVLLPVYNAEPYLNETLDSLLRQTTPADQIIIVNDGSTDRSIEVLERYARSESRIQILSQENAGASSARNLGLTHCEGDYVALMDADDICQPTRFEIQLDAMVRRGLDLCGSWIKTFGTKEREVRYPTSDAELRFNYLFLGRTIPNPSAMIRRDSLGNLRYDERLVFAEDFGFFLSLLLANPALRMTNIPRPLLHYRTHPQQASQRHAERNESSLKLLLSEKFNERGFSATEQQVDAHYQLWRNKAPASLEQLEAYLPFMHALIKWAEQAPGTERLSEAHWNRLLRQHTHLGKEGATRIRAFAGDPPTLRSRLLRLFT